MSNKKSTAVVAEVKGSKGRPTVAGSARQARLAAREARVAAGLSLIHI